MINSTLFARCVVSVTLAAAVFVSCWTPALAAGPSKHAHAVQVCNSGAGEGFGHPSNACWAVYEAAFEARDYNAALEAVHIGCRHKRVDFCLFVANVNVSPATIQAASTATERYNIRRAFENAEAFVTMREIEDAEAPLFAAEASKSRRLHAQRNARAKMRLAGHASTRTQSQRR
jgi:hypothetical protein